MHQDDPIVRCASQLSWVGATGSSLLEENRPIRQDKPEIQDYRTLAAEYDRLRYVGQVNLLNEGFRRRALVRLLPNDAERALDVACGTGRGVLMLQERSRLVVGVDGTLDMLRHARGKTRDMAAFYCRANGAQLPFPDDTFDLVTCLNFLHLFPEKSAKVAFVLEAARVLKRGGTAIFEFDNALHGLLLGPFRKYFGKDIGYDWPWTVHSCFAADTFRSVTVLGANIPFVWRVPPLRGLESAALVFPFKYLANRLFVRAVRR